MNGLPLTGQPVSDTHASAEDRNLVAEILFRACIGVDEKTRLHAADAILERMVWR